MASSIEVKEVTVEVISIKLSAKLIKQMRKCEFGESRPVFEGKLEGARVVGYVHPTVLDASDKWGGPVFILQFPNYQYRLFYGMWETAKGHEQLYV